MFLFTIYYKVNGKSPVAENKLKFTFVITYY